MKAYFTGLVCFPTTELAAQYITDACDGPACTVTLSCVAVAGNHESASAIGKLYPRLTLPGNEIVPVDDETEYYEHHYTGAV